MPVFKRSKSSCLQHQFCHSFNLNLPVIVATDASDYGIGAVLQQQDGNIICSIQYASRALTPAVRKYSTKKKEPLACLWACKKWHSYLWGRRFTLTTDHQALVTLLSTKGLGRRPLRINRWSDRLLNYTFDVQYRKEITIRSLMHYLEIHKQPRHIRMLLHSILVMVASLHLQSSSICISNK